MTYKVIDRRGERKSEEEASTPSSSKKPVVAPAPAPPKPKQMFEPLYDRIMVLPDGEEVTAGKIIISQESQEMRSGTVVAVGEGRVKDNGDVVPLRLKPMDKVLFGKYAGSEIRLDGQHVFLVMREAEVFGKVNG
jgi:chaperonin GroES